MCAGCENVFNLLEVFRVVSCDADCAGGFQAADELVGVGEIEEPAFVVALLGPGVRKVNMKAIDAGIGDIFANELCRVGADYPDVGEIPSADSVDGKTVISASPFDAEEIDAGMGFCLINEECPLA